VAREYPVMVEETFEAILVFGGITEAVAEVVHEVVGVMIVETEIVTWIEILEALGTIEDRHSETIETMIEIGGIERTASEDAEHHRLREEADHQITAPV